MEQEWGVDLISSWNKHGWFTMANRVGAKMAKLIGAKAHEVMVADSTSVNLFKVVSAALQLRPHRRIIVSGTVTGTIAPYHNPFCARSIRLSALHQVLSDVVVFLAKPD